MALLMAQTAPMKANPIAWQTHFCQIVLDGHWRSRLWQTCIWIVGARGCLSALRKTQEAREVIQLVLLARVIVQTRQSGTQADSINIRSNAWLGIKAADRPIVANFPPPPPPPQVTAPLRGPWTLKPTPSPEKQTRPRQRPCQKQTRPYQK